MRPTSCRARLVTIGTSSEGGTMPAPQGASRRQPHRRYPGAACRARRPCRPGAWRVSIPSCRRARTGCTASSTRTARGARRRKPGSRRPSAARGGGRFGSHRGGRHGRPTRGDHGCAPPPRLRGHPLDAAARLSRWLRIDLPSKARALGVPVTDVEMPMPWFGGRRRSVERRHSQHTVGPTQAECFVLLGSMAGMTGRPTFHPAGRRYGNGPGHMVNRSLFQGPVGGPEGGGYPSRAGGDG